MRATDILLYMCSFAYDFCSVVNVNNPFMTNGKKINLFLIYNECSFILLWKLAIIFGSLHIHIIIIIVERKPNELWRKFEVSNI